jgi:excisionase family DNA binding protein
MMCKNIHDDALVVHLTVNQIKEVMESVFQQSSPLASNQPDIIDIEEVSKVTGYRKSTIYKLIHERKIPFHKHRHMVGVGYFSNP